jgi:hypothetical protein
VKAWGFEPKTVYTWRKVDKNGNDRLGAGRYGRNVTEHAILAVRGKPVIDAADQPNIFDAPRTSRHSQKPDRFFEIVEKVTPCAPEARIELFAVDERKGWNTSGSEQQAKARAKRPDAKARERAAPPEPDARYRCGNCGRALAEWKGKCPACGTWGEVVEAALGESYRSITWQTKKPTVTAKDGRFFITETGSHGLAPTWKTKPGDEIDLTSEVAHELVRGSRDGFGKLPNGFAAAVAAARAKSGSKGTKKPELIIRWGKPRDTGAKLVRVGKGLSGLTYKIEKGSATIGAKFSLLTQFPAQVRAGGASVYGSFSAVNPEDAPHAPLLSVADCLELADALEARELKQRAKAKASKGGSYRKLEWHPRRPNSEIVAVAKGRSGRRYVIKRGGTKADPHFDMTYEALQGSRLGEGPGGHHLLDSIEKAKASADQHERRELGLDS